MVTSGNERRIAPKPADGEAGQMPLDHYLRIIMHRKWLALGVWLLVTVGTFVVSWRLPDTYTSETVILVDPQKVPEAYVKATVTGDIRNRLGTLSQQILSATRLQKIIDTLNLYPEERKRGMAREDIITLMRSDIFVRVVSEFGSNQDLQAFRITYSGREPRLVAQVTNQLANLFIEENLKARQDQAQGTTDFLENRLQEARKKLEEQETRVKDFRLKHVGEMPEQQTADLQLLGQVQSQLQLESDAVARAEQQKSYIQSMMAQATPVVDLDDGGQTSSAAAVTKAPSAPKPLVVAKAKLAELLSHYGEQHPDVKRLQRQIEDEEAREAKQRQEAPAPADDAQPARAESPKRPVTPPVRHFNPVLQSELSALDAEIVKRKAEQQRLTSLVATYRSKLDAIPVREQEFAALQRDYEISKKDYDSLQEKHLLAQTATQLEFRQKGEKFEIIDPAQPAERPARPNRLLINLAGTFGGLVLGLMLATAKEFFAASITVPQDIAAVCSLAVLGVIPVILTHADQRLRRKRLVFAAATFVVAALAGGAIFLYRYRTLV
ncbi:MAG TPA: GNVR domain-containing protein [Bryobacteraceae bacterium]|nr:GNVR domain-containing protein [Bryobacteraceae bacterium]HXJ14740.1 GNVR domain-containing protein [Candidatus Limnocylindrales bacterium]HXJ41505.1 GNVR domain-containing protein [Bryobacteraceae bacterium]